MIRATREQASHLAFHKTASEISHQYLMPSSLGEEKKVNLQASFTEQVFDRTLM